MRSDLLSNLAVAPSSPQSAIAAAADASAMPLLEFVQPAHWERADAAVEPAEAMVQSARQSGYRGYRGLDSF